MSNNAFQFANYATMLRDKLKENVAHITLPV